MLTPQYIHLKPTASLDNVEVNAPFAAIVLIDAAVSPEWRHIVSEWLVENGCLSMMAWGDECSLWDDSVDWANIEAYKFKDIPEDKFVTTSWHDDESIQQVFYFTLTSLPFYPLIKSIAIFEISDTARQHEILADFKSAQSEINEDNNVKKFASKPFFKTYF